MAHIDTPKIGGGLTQKQENFCLHYVQTGNPVASFKASYKAGGKATTIARDCNKLLRNQKILERIAELRKGMQERCEITAADVVRELWDNSKRAKDRHMLAASNQALIAIGNSLGMFDRKIDAEPSVVEKLPPELRALLRKALEAERERRRAAETPAGAGPVQPDAGSTASTLQ